MEEKGGIKDEEGVIRKMRFQIKAKGRRITLFSLKLGFIFLRKVTRDNEAELI